MKHVPRLSAMSIRLLRLMGEPIGREQIKEKLGDHHSVTATLSNLVQNGMCENVHAGAGRLGVYLITRKGRQRLDENSDVHVPDDAPDVGELQWKAGLDLQRAWCGA